MSRLLGLLGSRAARALGTKVSGAFFCLAFYLSPAAAVADCARLDLAATPEKERVLVARVHDGDSLRLRDGRKLRLIGVNTPELARDGRPSEALARAARRRLLQSVESSGSELWLVYGAQRQDRYGRQLVHLYDGRGNSLAAGLLRSGLGFHVAIAPNISRAECYGVLEARARTQGLGVWGHSDWRAVPVVETVSLKAGYQRLRGRLRSVSRPRPGADVWLAFEGEVVARISADSVEYFDLDELRSWRGRQLELQGWLVDRSNSAAVRRGFKPWMLLLTSPYGVRLLPAVD